MTTFESSTSYLSGVQQQLMDRLSAFRQRVRLHLLLEGAARVLLEAVGLALLSLIIDRWLRLSLPTRIVLLLIGLCAMAYETWRYLVLPLRLGLDWISLAAAIDRCTTDPSRESLAARVASVLELPSQLDGPFAPSRSMVQRAVMRCHEALDNVDFSRQFNERRFNASVAVFCAALLIPLLFALFAPATSSLWAQRWLFGSNQPWPQRTYLELAGLEDGKMVVPRGEPYVLRVSAREGSIEPDSISLRVRQGREILATAAMTRYGTNDFRYDGPPLQQAGSIELWGGDDAQGPIEIDPVDRPRITQLELTSQHPTQAKPEKRTFSGQDADTAFLPKTALELIVTSNVPLAEARLKSSAAHPDKSDLHRLDARRFALRWTHEQPVHMEIELLSAEAKLASLPTPLTIGIKSDLPPRVGLLYSGVRQRITPMAKIPLTVQARDDYGIVRVDMTIKTELSDGGKTLPPQSTNVALMGPVSPPTDLEAQPQHTVEVSPLKLSPGGLLSISASATDACYTGPQTGQSRVASFRIVSPEELFREILVRQQGERAKFRRVIEQSQGLRDQINTLVSQEAASQVARQHRLVQREVFRIQNSLTEALTEMRLNALGSPEAYDLMERNIIAPMKSMHDVEMSQQRDLLDSLGKADSAGQLADASNRQEQLISKMQDILKQMSQWDSFVDVLNQLNEIIKLETQVKTTTDDMQKKQTESIFDR